MCAFLLSRIYRHLSIPEERGTGEIKYPHGFILLALLKTDVVLSDLEKLVKIYL